MLLLAVCRFSAVPPPMTMKSYSSYPPLVEDASAGWPEVSTSVGGKDSVFMERNGTNSKYDRSEQENWDTVI